MLTPLGLEIEKCRNQVTITVTVEQGSHGKLGQGMRQKCDERRIVAAGPHSAYGTRYKHAGSESHNDTYEEHRIIPIHERSMMLIMLHALPNRFETSEGNIDDEN